ncbi:low-CO2-inducible chloroplast envelope protein [Scenedesmus sp. NREL 46B-D3]|nr:low-CO2-inducible chloroplast envelope protein [Scenedesmus sp. NREL 46B-D3]
MPATAQVMNDTLMEVEHTPQVHKRVLDILPGVSGGVARIMVGQPFDTIKTRLQVLGRGTIGAAGMPPEMVYSNGLDCVRKMMKSEGPFSLYKGTVAPLLGNMVLLGIHFPTFTKTRAYLESGDAQGAFTPWKILAAGAAAGAAGSVVSSPTELIRTKMQMVRKNNILAQMKGAAVGGLNPEENYKGNWDCARKVLRNHGLRGIYSGYMATLLRDMQGYAWFFLGYEATIHYLAGPGKTKADLDYMQVMIAGVMAGFGLWGSMFPIDTIKSKIQADSLSKPEFKGTIDCLRRSLAVEGHSGLWRGVTAALWRAIPVNAAIFLAVEGTRELLADTEESVDAFIATLQGKDVTTAAAV